MSLYFVTLTELKKIWVIGLININIYEFILETILKRNSEIIKKIIKFHICTDNNIITDKWPA